MKMPLLTYVRLQYANSRSNSTRRRVNVCTHIYTHDVLHENMGLARFRSGEGLIMVALKSVGKYKNGTQPALVEVGCAKRSTSVLTTAITLHQRFTI